MSGQKSFDWVEDDHPRETEEHDGKKPGEFAPKRYQEWDSQRHPRDGDKPTSYLTGHSSPPVREAAKKNAGLGLLITPYTQHYVGHAEDYSHIALDNGVYSEFTGTQPFSPERFRALIAKVASKPELAGKTQFVVAPDVVGDWEKTLERSKPWLAEIRKSGLPVAFAAQDGIEKHPEKIPWDDFDVLFIGGSTAWKLGFNPIDGVFRPTDAQLRKSGFNNDFTKMLKQARAKGKRIHMGRVNSWKRAEMANYGMQLDTMDGNFIGVAPDKNLPQVLSWLDAITRGMKKPEELTPSGRGWTNNGDGTYTSPNGTVWRKAKAGGETSPVTGGQFKGGALMPIHGLASGLPKPEPKPKRDNDLGQSKVDDDGRQKDDWREPKVRQLTPEQIEQEKQGRERQRKWDEITSGIIGKSLGLGDRPHNISRGWGIAKVWMEEAERIGPEATKKLVDAAKKVALKTYTELYRGRGDATPEKSARETLDWRHSNWQESLRTQGDVFTKKHKAKNPHTAELRHYVELALEGAGDQIDNLHEIHKALSDAEKHCAQVEVDRYAQPGTPEFNRWFSGSHVTGQDGKPLRVYRGQHGDGGKPIETRQGAVTFSSSPEVAGLYATEPNVRGEVAKQPRTMPAYLSIKKPFIRSPHDPFIDGQHLIKHLGQGEARRILNKFADHVHNTSQWQEEINGNGEFEHVSDFLAKHPQRAGELYFDAYHLFDDPKEVAGLKAKGFDGAIHGGSQGDDVEYKVFDHGNILPAFASLKHWAESEVDRYGRVKPMAGQASFDFDRQEPAPAIKATPTPPPAPEPENEPEPTSPLAIKLKRYLELQQKAVRQGLGERRTNLLK
jgi:hypothetical protein